MIILYCTTVIAALLVLCTNLLPPPPFDLGLSHLAPPFPPCWLFILSGFIPPPHSLIRCAVGSMEHLWQCELTVVVPGPLGRVGHPKDEAGSWLASLEHQSGKWLAGGFGGGGVLMMLDGWVGGFWFMQAGSDEVYIPETADD